MLSILLPIQKNINSLISTDYALERGRRKKKCFNYEKCLKLIVETWVCIPLTVLLSGWD